MSYYKYGEIEISHLKKTDPILGEAIERIGLIERETEDDIFTSLIDCIISQQVSGKASETIFNRLKELCDMTPQSILELDNETIRSCGISRAKTNYIQNVCEAVLNGSLKLDEFCKLSDEQVAKAITSIKGLGNWSAEMVLIFALQRKDVVSYTDLAIIRGMKILYGLSEVTPEVFNNLCKKYSPYGTVASLYLWEISSEK